MDCKNCGHTCAREEAHNGLAMLYGPWGCPSCGWSEDPRFDFSDGRSRERYGGTYDQYGMWLPPAMEHQRRQPFGTPEQLKGDW